MPFSNEPMMTYIIHPKGRSRCFVLDKKFEVAKFTHRQNQSVEVRLYLYMYLIPLSTLGAFSMCKTRQI